MEKVEDIEAKAVVEFALQIAKNKPEGAKKIFSEEKTQNIILRPMLLEKLNNGMFSSG